MSVQALSWVFDHSRSEGNARLVLLSIANHTDRQGAESWPSSETIARESRCSPRTVFRALRELKGLGELDWVSGGGRKTPNYYWMPLFRISVNLSPFPPRNPDTSYPKLCQLRQKTMTPVAEEPSLTVKNQDRVSHEDPKPNGAAKARRLREALASGDRFDAAVLTGGHGAEGSDEALGLPEDGVEFRVGGRTNVEVDERVVRLVLDPVEDDATDTGDHAVEAGR